MSMATHYCSNPKCQLCRTGDAIDLLLYDLGMDREDIASGNVWPEEDPCPLLDPLEAAVLRRGWPGR